jgi:hypothetical protein
MNRQTVLVFALFLTLSFTPIEAAVTDVAATPEPTMIDEALARSVVDRIAIEVARIRALEFKQPVPVSVVNDEQALAQNLESLEEQGALEELVDAERVMKHLGLAESTDNILELFTDAMREQIGGYYDPRVGEFYLLDDMAAGMVEILTAHELTHALEDQHFELDKLLDNSSTNDDALFARSSVIEGSATLLMTLYTVQMALADLDEETLSGIQDEAVKRLPASIMRQMLAPYTLFVQRGNAMNWMASGFPAEEINNLYNSPPLSSEQILHPEKYWDADKRDDPILVTMGDAGAALGNGWSAGLSDVLGEINLAVMVGAKTPSPEDPEALMGLSWTNSAARGWGGDRYQLWRNGDRSLLLLSTVWDTERDADQFVAAMAGSEKMQLIQKGDRVAMVFGDCPRKRAKAALTALLREPLAP